MVRDFASSVGYSKMEPPTRTTKTYPGWPWFGRVHVRFGGGQFERFRFSVPAVPQQNGLLLSIRRVQFLHVPVSIP